MADIYKKKCMKMLTTAQQNAIQCTTWLLHKCEKQLQSIIHQKKLHKTQESKDLFSKLHTLKECNINEDLNIHHTT